MNNLFLKVCLHQAGKKIPVGELAHIEREIYFEYDPEFIQQGCQISPFNLPLRAGVYQDKEKTFQGLPGVFYDSLPDGWGLLVMDRYFRNHGIDPIKISPLLRLQYLGEQSMGAFSYEPAIALQEKSSKQLNLDLLAAECEQVLQGDEAEILPELLVAAGSSGGARPKVFIGYNPNTKQICLDTTHLKLGFQHYLVKFSQMVSSTDSAELEYAYALLAKSCGINMMPVRLLDAKKAGKAFATVRFDRDEQQRVHVHSLSGLLHTHYRMPNLDYIDFLKATWQLTQSFSEVLQGFRRMVFNVLMHNRDDHSKNFSYLMVDQSWQLSPAFDLTFSEGVAGQHTMTIAGEGANPGMAHFLQVAEALDIKRNVALEIIDEVVAGRHQWLQFAQQAELPKRVALRVQKVIMASNSS